MKIFISQPMNGKCDKEIVKAKESALYKFNKYLEHEYDKINEGKTKGLQEVPVVEVINTDYNGNAMQFLGKSISEGLALADTAIFLPGWSNARGCKIEHDIAIAYGVKTFYINT
jgi:hypothetical protein